MNIIILIVAHTCGILYLLLWEKIYQKSGLDKEFTTFQYMSVTLCNFLIGASFGGIFVLIGYIFLA